MPTRNCENCLWHEDCICVVCEDGDTVVCIRKATHVLRTECCPDFVWKGVKKNG